MANCPKCGRKLTLLDWKPNCPECGVNLVYYGMEERLLDEADAAEAEHARLQKRIDRLKTSFIGSKLTIARIFLSIIPIVMLLLPLCSITYCGPFIDETTKTINAIELYNLISSLDFDALFTMVGSPLLGASFISYAGALVCVLLSLVFVILSLLMLTIACGRRGNARNITLNSIAIILAVASIGFYTSFLTNITAFFPEFVLGGGIGLGVIFYIVALVALLTINIVIAKKGLEIKYKQCYVGGIPAEQYFELVEKGTDKAVIREMMAKALDEMESKKEAKEEAKA